MKSKFDTDYMIAAYVRVSTQRQALVKEGSLKNQEERIRSWFDYYNTQNGNSLNWDKNVVIFREEGKSAKDIKQRPRFKEMLDEIQRGRIHNVVVSSIDRIFRNIRDALDFITLINKINVDFTSLKENFDTSTATGRAFLNIMMVFAQMEREQTSERVRIGNRQRIDRGLWTFARVPYGYEMDKSNIGSLHVIDSERAGVDLAFSKYLEKGSIRDVVKIMNEHGFRTKNGTLWKHDTIYRLLKNKAYIGLVQINKKNQSKSNDNLPKADRYMERKGNWEPIIDDDLFLRVQELLHGNGTSKTNRIKVNKYPYIFQGGILQCSQCGGIMSGTSTKKKSKKYIYYYCNNCRFQVTSSRLEGIVFKIICDILESDTIIKKVLEKVQKRRNGINMSLSNSLINAKKVLSAIQKKIEVQTIALGNTKSDSIIETIHETLNDLLKEKDHIQYVIEDLEIQIQAWESRGESFQSLDNITFYRKIIQEHMSRVHIRQIMPLLFSRMRVGDNRITLGIKGESGIKEFDIYVEND